MFCFPDVQGRVFSQASLLWLDLIQQILFTGFQLRFSSENRRFRVGGCLLQLRFGQTLIQRVIYRLDISSHAQRCLCFALTESTPRWCDQYLNMNVRENKRFYWRSNRWFVTMRFIKQSSLLTAKANLLWDYQHLQPGESRQCPGSRADVAPENTKTEGRAPHSRSLYWFKPSLSVQT